MTKMVIRWMAMMVKAQGTKWTTYTTHARKADVESMLTAGTNVAHDAHVVHGRNTWWT